MRARHIALIALWLLIGYPVLAGPLGNASWVGDFQGTPFTLVPRGGGLSGTINATSVSLRADAPVMTHLDLGGQAPIFLSQTLGGSQTIRSDLGVDRGISGALRAYIGTDTNGTLLFSVPLSIGAGGSFQRNSLIPGIAVPVQVTVTYFPWTTGSHVFTGLTGTTTTPNGARNQAAALPDITVAGTSNLNRDGGGSITLVAPTRFSVCAGELFGTFPCTPGDPNNVFGLQSATTTSLRMVSSNVFDLLPFRLPEPRNTLLYAAVLVAIFARMKSATN